MTTNKTMLGVACFITAYMVLAIDIMISKVIMVDHNAIEVSAYRYCAGFIVLLAYSAYKKESGLHKVKKPIAIAARVLVNISCVLLSTYFVSKVSLSYTTVFTFIGPLFVPIIAAIFLKEKIGPQRCTAVIVGMCGVLIIAQPTGDISPEMIAVGMLIGLTYALSSILMRYLRSEDPLSINFYIFLCGAVLGLCALPFIGTVPSMQNMILLATIGATMLIAQLLFTFSFRCAEASALVPLSYTMLIWTAIFDAVIWSIYPTLNIWIGTAIIASATIFITYREAQIAKIRQTESVRP